MIRPACRAPNPKPRRPHRRLFLSAPLGANKSAKAIQISVVEYRRHLFLEPAPPTHKTGKTDKPRPPPKALSEPPATNRSKSAKPLCAFTFRPAPCLEIPDGTKPQADKAEICLPTPFSVSAGETKQSTLLSPSEHPPANSTVEICLRLQSPLEPCHPAAGKSRPTPKTNNPRKTPKPRQNAKRRRWGPRRRPCTQAEKTCFNNLENNSGDRGKSEPRPDARNLTHDIARKRSISTWKRSISCRKSLETPSLSRLHGTSKKDVPALFPHP